MLRQLVAGAALLVAACGSDPSEPQAGGVELIREGGGSAADFVTDVRDEQSSTVVIRTTDGGSGRVESARFIGVPDGLGCRTLPNLDTLEDPTFDGDGIVADWSLEHFPEEGVPEGTYPITLEVTYSKDGRTGTVSVSWTAVVQEIL